MNAEIIAVGSEILIGDICNTHAQYLSQELTALGVNVLWHTSVGDNPGRLKEIAQRALGRSDLVVFTGGLGPTEDDLTKQTVCEALQIELVKNDSIARDIEQYFRKMGREMSESNYKQALMPKGAKIFPNSNGTAPGFAIQKDHTIALLLPGPPGELTPMYQQSVRPFLQACTDAVILSHNIHFFGIGESKVDQVLNDMLNGSNPSIGLYAKQGEVRARLTARANSKQECEAMLKPLIDQIQQRLKEYIYGIDVSTLENALVLAATQRKATVAVAESCTGGMIASRIASVAGASQCFCCGAVTYSNEMKQRMLGVSAEALKEHGAVSPQVAEQMAQQVRELAHATVGVSTTGIAGPSGGTPEKPVGLVYVGVSTRSGNRVYKLTLSKGLEDERESIRNQAAMFALNAAREAVQSL